MIFTARLHHPTAPVTGIETQVEFSEHELRFLLDGSWQAVAYPQLKLQLGGWDESQCEFVWEKAGQWQLSFPLAEARKTWLMKPPSGLALPAAALLKGQGRKAKKRGCGWTLLMSFLIAPVALLAVFWFARGPIGSYLVHWVPVKHEAEFGDGIYKNMKSNLREMNAGAAVSAVKEMGARLTQGSVYSYHWHVVEDEEVNAFAIPGGHVVVNSGLIQKAASAEELAGVLAHEIQHVERRHSLRGAAGQLIWQILLGLVWDGGSTLGGVASNLGSLSFSREDEREADERGLKAMVTAGINPQGMVEMMKKLAEGQTLEVPLLQTHPATAERIQRLQSLVDELPAKSYPSLPYSWEEVKKSLP
jgi:beta-barrel assembly-enhancing protease